MQAIIFKIQVSLFNLGISAGNITYVNKSLLLVDLTNQAKKKILFVHGMRVTLAIPS